MRNEVETRLWWWFWFGVCGVVFEGWRQGFRAEVFGVGLGGVAGRKAATYFVRRQGKDDAG